MIIAAAALLLSGCTGKAEKAERQAEIVESGRVTYRDACASRRKVADAYLADGNQDGYKQAKLKADVICSNASYTPDRQYIPPHV